MHFLLLMTEGKASIQSLNNIKMASVRQQYTQYILCRQVPIYIVAMWKQQQGKQPHSSRPLLTQNWKPMTDGETAAANQYRFGLKISTTKLVIGKGQGDG